MHTYYQVLNTIAVHYDTIGALPVSVMLKMAAIWLFVALPLSVGGTYININIYV